jgi:TonB family protein
MGALPREIIQRVINQHRNQIRYCYEIELQRQHDLEGRVAVRWITSATGAVARVDIAESTLNNDNVESCIRAKIRAWQFPAPAGGGIVEVNYPFVFRPTGGGGGASRSEPITVPLPSPRLAQPRHVDQVDDLRAEQLRVSSVPPYMGRFATIKSLLAAGRRHRAHKKALAWRAGSPGDVMALLALGKTYAAIGENDSAARAYGSLIDLFPFRADMRRHAGQRLEELNTRAALALALDSYAKAVEQRPDHPSSHRLYAYALLKVKRHKQAFAALSRYYSRGPMGYGMGKLQVIEHDGSGGLRFDERPFVIMRDGAYVDLGRVTAR